jgi:hypothetical protein
MADINFFMESDLHVNMVRYDRYDLTGGLNLIIQSENSKLISSKIFPTFYFSLDLKPSTPQKCAKVTNFLKLIQHIH